MGKKSTGTLLEELLKKPIEKILIKHFKGIKTNEEAVKKLSEISNGEIKTSHVTIHNMIYRVMAEGKIDIKDFPFAHVEMTKEKGQRGIKPARDVLEEKHGKSFWEILEPFTSLSKEDAAKELGISTATLLLTIKRAVERNEEFNGKPITLEDFSKWVCLKRGRKPRKEKNKNAEENQIESDDPRDTKFKVRVVCSECGETNGWYDRLSSCGQNFDLGLKARRCPHCQKWGTYEATFEINGVSVKKKLIPHGDYTFEDFIDSKGKLIRNPVH